MVAKAFRRLRPPLHPDVDLDMDNLSERSGHSNGLPYVKGKSNIVTKHSNKHSNKTDGHNCNTLTFSGEGNNQTHPGVIFSHYIGLLLYVLFLYF